MKVLISISENRMKSFFERNNQNSDEFRIFGVNGRNLSAQEYFEMGVARKRRLLTPSEVGCALSHLAAYEAFLSSEETDLLVFEDDVEIHEIPENLKSVLTANREIPVLIILGGQNGLKARTKLLGKRSSLSDGLWEIEPKGTRWLFRTCGYLMNREMVKLVLQNQRSSLRVADSWAHYFKKPPCKIFFTECVSHPIDLTESHIENERTLGFYHDESIFRLIVSKLFSALTLFLLVSKGNKRIQAKVQSSPS